MGAKLARDGTVRKQRNHEPADRVARDAAYVGSYGLGRNAVDSTRATPVGSAARRAVMQGGVAAVAAAT